MRHAPIDVPTIVQAVGGFDHFWSVDKLDALVESLRGDAEFEIRQAGASENGHPIHHVRFGAGSVRALLVGFPDANEPIGGLTVSSLLRLLAARHPSLIGVDVEWHVVPCIDPDGAALNEGWTQRPFEINHYMRNFHRPAARDQIDCSFPIQYKRLKFNAPVTETQVLMNIIERVRPDFYYALHNNSGAMGVWLLTSRNIGQPYHQQLHRLLAEFGMPVQISAPFGGQLDRFDEGIYENVSTRKLYDILARHVPAPEEVMQSGARSFDYVAEANPHALSFVSELPYVTHPSSGLRRPTGEHLRGIKLRIDAENKFLATRLLEEWSLVKDEIQTSGPLYKKVISDLILVRDQLPEGLPCWPRKTRDTLFNPAYGKPASEGERFEAYMLERFFVLCHYYEFVQLLKASRISPVIAAAIDRLEGEFDHAMRTLDAAVDLGKLQLFALDDLAKVQLGSGLIVLNSLLHDAKG